MHFFCRLKSVLLIFLCASLVNLENQSFAAPQSELNAQLILAVQTNDQDGVETALDNGANPNAQDTDQVNALHYAAEKGYTSITKKLIKSGANVNMQDTYGRTALCIAASLGYPSIVNTLVEAGANVNAQDTGGMTALHWAALGDYLSIVKKLLEAGANVNTQDTYGRTALYLAQQDDYNEVAEMLSDPKKRKVSSKEGCTEAN